jgi:hypothetical protein
LPEQIKKALKIALIFVPGNLRTNCSFDTYSKGVNLVRNYSWGIGFPAPSDAPPHLSVVDTGSKTVFFQLPVETFPYEEWLNNCIAQGKFEDIQAYNSIVHEFQKFLTGASFDEKILRDALENLPHPFLSHMDEIYREQVNTKITRNLEEIAGPRLALRFIDELLSDMESQPGKPFSILLDGFDVNQLADRLFGIYKKDILDEPGRQEIKELKVFLRKVKHDYLGLLIPIWKEEYEDLVSLLDRLPEAAYREMTGLLVESGAVPLGKLMKGERVDTFLKIVSEHAETDETIQWKIPHLIKELVSFDQQSKAEVFSSLLDSLNFIELKKIKKVVQKVGKDKPFTELFLEKLEAAWVSSPRKKSKGFLNKVLDKINVFSRSRG